MTADTINLAEHRPSKGPLTVRTPDNVDAYVSAALRRVAQAHILRRIQQIADDLGIDVEAPFRAKPGRGA
jgi:hypothetical protein